MQAVKSLLSPVLGIGSGGIHDTLKLVVIGGTVETARRASVSAWNGFVDSFFLTAHFSQEDYPYDWLMHWLSKQPAWGRSREFEITTRSANSRSFSSTTTGDLDEDEEEDGLLVHGRRKRKVAFMPSPDTTHTIYYRGHWLRITRIKKYPDDGFSGSLKVSVVARNNDIIKKLVLEAKREYERDAEHRVHIFMADTSYGCWRWNGARQKRPMSSIVLQPGVKDMLLADCKDFLSSEDWCVFSQQVCIPFRRGYLLHGVPGSGKTSLIHSLAGELGLDIYVVSLSSKGMSDNTLTTLMGNVPSRCILLLEDLDAAFTRSVSRDSTSTGVPIPTTTTTATANANAHPVESDGSTLSLSGLLNSLDGVAAAEGRLLFATTNHIERLDPALSRPGRMDVWVNFKNATKWQAEGIFKCFFPSAKSKPATDFGVTDASQKNIPGSKSKGGMKIPLLTEEELDELAKRFADAIPEDELSVAALQGYLLRNKTRPRECVGEVGDWVIEERATRERLKKEKAEVRRREAKEKREAEEALKKLQEEKAAKERLEHRELQAIKMKKLASMSSSSSATPVTSPTSDSSGSASSAETSGIDADTEEEEDVEAASTKDPKKEDKWVSVVKQCAAIQTNANTASTSVPPATETSSTESAASTPAPASA
ncbi:P-loop containing nucleoside triphosphate hydrolase protein [Fistulina hepatica ATCC 64428]|uniref:p-loop containing nucleoside triphosphate hydrolase protein n=1 Tax=Fistulina hepatica ATCC 64428 TaxID=1128425 RepID=A0A0D7AJ36_9AGAR|nr:P-loop containing nucleoside triphosphate hydrolase protein [Fistulina hepatica ATCC 64428]